MIISLSLHIFTHNKKRTFQAVSLLAISVGLFVSSSLIVSGFSSELTNLTNLLPPSHEYVIIKRGESLTTSTITFEEIHELLTEFNELPGIDGAFPFNISFTNLTVYNYKIQTYLFQTNFTTLNMYYSREVIPDTVTTGIVLSQIFTDRYSIDLNQTVLVNSIRTQVQAIRSLPEFMNDWVLTNSSQYFTSSPGNVILVRFSEDLKSREVSQIIQSFPSFEFISLDQAKNFMQATSREFITTIFYFTIGFLVLTMLAIGYTIMALVRESEEEIVLFRILGFTVEQVVFLFLMQAFYVGVFGSFFAFGTSILLTMGLIALITSVIHTPFFVIGIDIMFFLEVMVMSIILSMIASIPASLYTEVIFKRSLK